MPNKSPGGNPVNSEKDYRFIKALRPFSLFIALASTGIIWARTSDHPSFSLLMAALVVTGALLAQAAVNLINDWSDRHLFTTQSRQYKLIRQNVRWAISMFGLAATTGIFITIVRGVPIIILALTGFFACLAYTFEPLNLKRRGLGLITVYLVMGPVLMIGSSYAMTGQWIPEAVTDSLIFSPLISLVLLANELRDFHQDQQTTDRTLTVRIGFKPAQFLFITLIAITFMAYGVALITRNLSIQWLFLAPAIIAIWLVHFLLRSSTQNLSKLPPFTGRLVLATGAVHILALLEI